MTIKTNLAGYLELADWIRGFGDEVVEAFAQADDAWSEPRAALDDSGD